MSCHGIEAKARKSGADEVVVMDLRQEFAEKYCFPMLRAHAIYEQDYLLGTSIARPLIAAKQVEVAHQTGADAVGHGATGKGNDQVRFELTYMALDPDAEDHRAVEGHDVRAARSRERGRVCREARRADPGQQEEDLLAGSQPLAHLARRRGDRASGQGAELGSVSDDDRRRRRRRRTRAEIVRSRFRRGKSDRGERQEARWPTS